MVSRASPHTQHPTPHTQQKNNDEDKGRSEMSERPFQFAGFPCMPISTETVFVIFLQAMPGGEIILPRRAGGLHPLLVFFALSGLKKNGVRGGALSLTSFTVSRAGF